MPRPREFDEKVALDAAIGCFWKHGYQATSVRDLTTSMGISGPSLYNAFGDKRDLFARALEHYLDSFNRVRIRRLEETLPPKQAIRRFFEEIVERSIGDRERRGCFLVNSALEVAPHDPRLGKIIAERLGEIEAFFRRSIRAAQAERTVPRNVRPADAARLLLGVLLGIRVLARAKPDKALLEGVARSALDILD